MRVEFFFSPLRNQSVAQKRESVTSKDVIPGTLDKWFKSPPRTDFFCTVSVHEKCKVFLDGAKSPNVPSSLVEHTVLLPPKYLAMKIVAPPKKMVYKILPTIWTERHVTLCNS